jgi:diguanylate cyclase (GGDEF)-like protein/PAS domain S-box-containing protein
MAPLVARRPIVLGACLLPFAVLLLVYCVSQRTWQTRAAELARENMTLRLREVASAVMAESEGLAADARILADSDVVVELAQAPAAPAHPDLGMFTALDLSELVVVNSADTVKFSGSFADHRLVDAAADPLLLRYLDSIIAARATQTSASGSDSFAELVDGKFVTARPIFSRSAPAAVGWLAAARAVSPAALNTNITFYPLREIARAAVSPDIATWVNTNGAAGMRVDTRIAADLTGWAVLRDASGRAQWLFRVERESAVTGVAPPAGAPGRSVVTVGGAVFGALLAATFAAIAIFGVQRYFRHRSSLDSRYKAIIDQTNDGIVIVDPSSCRIQYCNPAFLARVGCSNEEAKALTLSDIFTDPNSTPESLLARLKTADSQMALNMQLRCKSGAFLDIEVRCNTLDGDGSGGLAYVTHDVSVRRKAEQQLIDNQQRLDRMAHHDQLTGLPNRHYLAAFLPEAIEAARAASMMLGVVFLDLDRFKHINDTRGHEVGDKLLREVSCRLKTCVRESDVVIRMGGDEFVVVFRNVRSYEEVTLGANRIIEALKQPIVIDQHPLQTTGSVGVSMFPRDGDDMGELLKHSDTAMYQAKDRGRNNVQMFSQVMNRKLKHRVAMEASLREALRLKQLDVHYQPFVNLLTRKVVGLEALIRWRHPVHGMIPADQFIPVAEETGLIVPMGNFVLHRTMQTLSAWQRAGVQVVPISLNVAPAQLQRGELQSTIATLLKTHGLRPELLQLEMTERAMFDSNQPKAGENREDTLARLRDLGIKIAIDDFGTGYSSLSYLKNWRVDALKIDRCFVRDLVTDSSDLAIVSAIVAIARHLQIQVIAEGIEGYQQAEILRKLGCSIGQGFLFARPMPAEQCVAMLGENSASMEEEDMLAVFASGRA